MASRNGAAKGRARKGTRPVIQDGEDEFVLCRDDTGRACLYVGNPFRIERARDIQLINENWRTTGFYWRVASPLDHAWYELNPIFRERFTRGGSIRFVRVAFRGSGNESFDGRTGYAAKVSTKTDALFDENGFLLGDDVLGWGKLPAKLKHDEGDDVTELFLRPPVARFGIETRGALAA